LFNVGNLICDKMQEMCMEVSLNTVNCPIHVEACSDRCSHFDMQLNETDRYGFCYVVHSEAYFTSQKRVWNGGEVGEGCF
jgi:hypothetical protein